MYILNTNPENVLPTEHDATTSELENLASECRLEEVGLVLVFEISGIDRKLLGADYILIDGHHRREAALRAGVELSIMVIEKPLDFKATIDYNEPEFYCASQTEFDMWREESVENAIYFRQRNNCNI